LQNGVSMYMTVKGRLIGNTFLFC